MRKDQIPPFLTLVLKRLRAFNHQAFIVGGAVRDALLGRPITDWDVTTSGSPDDVAEIFRDVRQVRFKGGTTVLIHDGHHHEVTAFRGERASIEGDLACRDFTINAMAYDDRTDVILDPFHGREDLLQRRVKAVGGACERFKEDPLRLLRAVRLATDLNFCIEPATSEAISRMAPLLVQVSPERVREELIRTTMTSKPSTGLRWMERLGILPVILPELFACRTVHQTAGSRRESLFDHLLETLDRVEAAPRLRLAALFHDVAKPEVKRNVAGSRQFPDHAEASAVMAEQIMGRLRFSRKMIAQTSTLIRDHDLDSPMEKDSEIIDWVQRVGRDRVHDLIALRKADLMACYLHEQTEALDRVQTRVDALIKARMVLNPSDLALGGQEVMKTLGILPGPRVGKILRALWAWASEHPTRNNEETLTALLLEMEGRERAEGP